MTEGGPNTLSRANALSRNVFVLYTLMRDFGRCRRPYRFVDTKRRSQGASQVEEGCAWR